MFHMYVIVFFTGYSSFLMILLLIATTYSTLIRVNILTATQTQFQTVGFVS